jgi:hypothetical protein
MLSKTTVLGAGLLLLVGTAQALEGDADWNQEEVTKAARQLDGTVAGLIAGANLERGPSPGVTIEAKNYLLMEDMKALKRYTGRLAKRLEEGQDREQTAPLFDRIENLTARARASFNYSTLLQGAREQVEEARQVANQLRRYYGKPALPPITEGPIKQP